MDVIQRRASSEAGFSLIEIVIALGLLSLISLAGVGLVSSILQVKDRTAGRLEELGDLQRGFFLITSDFQQADGASINLTPSGVSADRTAGNGVTAVTYAVADGKMLRKLSRGGAPGVQQTLLANVKAARWRLLLRDGSWVETWPPLSLPDDAQAEDRAAPLALAVELDLDGGRAGVSGTLRRVVELAARP